MPQIQVHVFQTGGVEGIQHQADDFDMKSVVGKSANTEWLQKANTARYRVSEFKKQWAYEAFL